MVDDDRTHYDFLGLEPDAGKGEIKQAYQEHLEAAQAAGDTDTVLRIRRAWQVLSDPCSAVATTTPSACGADRRPSAPARPSANGSHDLADTEEYADEDEEYEDDDDAAEAAPGTDVARTGAAARGPTGRGERCHPRRPLPMGSSCRPSGGA